MEEQAAAQEVRRKSSPGKPVSIGGKALLHKEAVARSPRGAEEGEPFSSTSVRKRGKV
jgi:hypothetical protein